MIREQSIRRLAICAVIIVCIALLLFMQSRYIQNFINGPYNFSAADLHMIHNVSKTPRYFAKISGSEAIETGLDKIEIHTEDGVETGRSMTARYYALVIGKKLLIYEGGYTPATTVEGGLIPIPDDLTRELFDTKEMQAIRSRFYPFYITKQPFRSTGYFVIAVLFCLGGFLAYIGIPAWMRLRDPALHPLIKRVSGWGNPHLISSATERQFSLPGSFQAGSWVVTKEFLIQSTFFRFDILRLSDLLWAYKTVTKNSINFIPTGKSYTARLVCSGGTAEIQGGEIRVDRVLYLAAESAPWAVFGFSEECQAYFNNNNFEFCATVKAKKKEFINQ